MIIMGLLPSRRCKSGGLLFSAECFVGCEAGLASDNGLPDAL